MYVSQWPCGQNEFWLYWDLDEYPGSGSVLDYMSRCDSSAIWSRWSLKGIVHSVCGGECDIYLSFDLADISECVDPFLVGYSAVVNNLSLRDSSPFGKFMKKFGGLKRSPPFMSGSFSFLSSGNDYHKVFPETVYPDWFSTTDYRLVYTNGGGSMLVYCILDEQLYWIYPGSIEKIKFGSVDDLYIAADSYLVDMRTRLLEPY